MLKVQIIILILLLPIVMKSQNVTATLGNRTACPPDSVMVPMDVTDFIDIAAMTFNIGYDTNSLSFASLENINPVIPGSILNNAVNGEVILSWSSLAAFTLINGTLFDLKFYYNYDTSALTFNFIEIANSNLQIIPVTTTPGGVFHEISITAQPDSVQAYPDSDVTFLVTSAGNDFFQWQEDTGNGWADISNAPPYSGATSQLLTITAVPQTFDENLYRCRLSTSNCVRFTETALLTVAEAFPEASIASVASCPAQEIFVPVEIIDFIEVNEFTFNISFDEGVLEFMQLENVHPDLQSGTLNTSLLSNPVAVSIHWTSTGSISLSNTTLFDLKFDFNEDDSYLNFIDGTQTLNIYSNIIDVTYNNGEVIQSETPEITSQPENITVEVGDEANFIVTASGATTYQWQLSENAGATWTDLVNNATYSNVNEPELLIHNVAYSLNENQYACMVGNTICVIKSQAAVLFVDTLNSVSDYKQHFIPDFEINPNPFMDHLSLKCSLPFTGNLEVKLINAQGITVKNAYNNHLNKGNYSLTIETTDLKQGIYIIHILFTTEKNVHRKSFKLIKPTYK